MRHLTALQLCAFLDDALVGSPDDDTARHLGACPVCHARYEMWSRGDDALRELLAAPPDDETLERWSQRAELAMTAERKGLPMPEFAELRLPLPASLPPPAPDVPRVGAGPSRLPGPTRFATHGIVLSEPPIVPAEPSPPVASWPAFREEPRPIAEPVVPRPEARILNLPGAAAAPAPVAPAARSGYARRPSGRPGWLVVLARGFGTDMLWVPLAIALGVLATAVFAPTLIRFTAGTRAHDHEPAAAPVRATPPAPPARGIADAPLTPVGERVRELVAEPVPPADSAAAATATGADDAVWPMLCGVVVDLRGAPIADALVSLPGPGLSVHTDGTGRFCVACPPGRQEVRVEALGHASLMVALQAGAAMPEARLTLDPVH